MTKNSEVLITLLEQSLELTAEDDLPRKCLHLNQIVHSVYVFFKEVMLAWTNNCWSLYLSGVFESITEALKWSSTQLTMPNVGGVALCFCPLSILAFCSEKSIKMTWKVYNRHVEEILFFFWVCYMKIPVIMWVISNIPLMLSPFHLYGWGNYFILQNALVFYKNIPCWYTSALVTVLLLRHHDQGNSL